MNKLSDIFYLVGNSSNDYPTELDMREASTKETELYEKLCSYLTDEQKVTLDEFYETVTHVQAMHEHIIVAKAIALGIQITSEAFLKDTGEGYER